MKTKTILKTIGFFIGWLLSFQLIGVSTYLMNQPSNISFTFGILLLVALYGALAVFGYKLGGVSFDLREEYLQSRKNKQDKQE